MGRKKVKIIYEKEGGKPEPRIIEPYGLVAKDTIWYVVARRGKEMRVYRISRIKEASITTERFERPKKFDLSKYWEEWIKEFKSRVPKYLIKVKVTDATAEHIKSIPYMKCLSQKPMEKGFTEMVIDMETKEWALGSMLQYCDSVFVLEPLELQEAIRHKAKEILKIYE